MAMEGQQQAATAAGMMREEYEAADGDARMTMMFETITRQQALLDRVMENLNSLAAAMPIPRWPAFMRDALSLRNSAAREVHIFVRPQGFHPKRPKTAPRGPRTGP